MRHGAICKLYALDIDLPDFYQILVSGVLDVSRKGEREGPKISIGNC